MALRCLLGPQTAPTSGPAMELRKTAHQNEYEKTRTARDQQDSKHAHPEPENHRKPGHRHEPIERRFDTRFREIKNGVENQSDH
jgi:hypothetical protein